MRTYLTPWGELPLVEAERDLELDVQPRHIAAGVAGDDQACALAQAVLEQTRAKAARIERTVAYVMFPDHVERYMLRTAARRAVIEFDMSNGESAPTGPIVLSKPTVSQTLDRMREIVTAWDPTGDKRKPARGPWGRSREYIDTLAVVGVRSGKGGQHTKFVKEE